MTLYCLFHTDTVVHIDIVKITRTFLQHRLCNIDLRALVGCMWSTGHSSSTLPWDDWLLQWPRYRKYNQSKFFLVGNNVRYANKNFKKSTSSFEPVLSIHCLAAIDLGARSSTHSIVSSSRTIRTLQFMGRWMHWTFEDNMVGSFFLRHTHRQRWR